MIQKFSVFSLWKVINFELLWKSGLETVSSDQNVKAIGNFSTLNWENTSLFANGNGTDFQPQFEGSDGPENINICTCS